MVMAEIFEKLKTLQDVLVEKYALEDKIENAPRQLDSHEELLVRLKKEYIDKNTVYDELRKKILDLKAELEHTEKIREQGEMGMDNITTHREYEALDKQISEASAKEQEIRKELSTQEKNLTTLQETLKSDEEMINSSEKDMLSSKEQLNEQLSSYNEQLDSLKKQESEISEGLDPEIVYKFQRIIQHTTKGIVAVKHGICEGCYMILPAQFANEVREGEKIMLCPYCSRILYYQESESSSDDSNYFTMDDIGGLSDSDFDDTEEESESDNSEDDIDLDEDETEADVNEDDDEEEEEEDFSSKDED